MNVLPTISRSRDEMSRPGGQSLRQRVNQLTDEGSDDVYIIIKRSQVNYKEVRRQCLEKHSQRYSSLVAYSAFL